MSIVHQKEHSLKAILEKEPRNAKSCVNYLPQEYEYAMNIVHKKEHYLKTILEEEP